MYKSVDLKDITKECRVVRVNGYNAVMYKDILLWTTIYDNIVKGQSITLNHYVEDEFEEYTIYGKTPVYNDPTDYDISTYGSFENLDEANEWLNNPQTLY